MDLRPYEDKYKQLMEKLPDRNCSFDDAECYAVLFFKACYEINGLIRDIRSEKILYKTLRDVAETDAFRKSEEKSATAKEKDVQIDEKYINAYSKYKQAEFNEDYFANLLRLFETAHKFYRDIAKEGQ